MEVIGGALRVCGGGEDGVRVTLQDFKPACDIGGVLLARLLMQFEVGPQESGAKLGDQFLAAVAFVVPRLAAEVAVEALRMLRPVRAFMGERGVIGFGVLEGLEGRHLHIVEFLRVIGAVSAVLDRGSETREKLSACAMRAIGSRERTILA